MGTTKEQIKLNRLIAEFMGGKAIVQDYHGINIIELPTGKTHDLSGMLYHSSWDWLMPVVDKIEQQGYGVEIVGNYTKIIGTVIQCSQPSKIESTYKAVVEFIKWYNENK